MTISVDNFTHFANMRFSNSDTQGRLFGVLAVKLTFDVGENGNFVLSGEQEPIVLTDAYRGAINLTSIRYPSDLVPYKPKTDVIFDAVARAPDGTPLSSWIFAVRVTDQTGIRVEKVMRVYGPRWWVPKWRRSLDADEQRNWRAHMNLFEGWELSEPKPITELPIHYEYAFGGTMLKGRDQQDKAIIEAFPYNPLGRGWIDKDWTDHTKPVPAPQIEFASKPVTDPYRKYYPAGLGPIPPVWLPRRPLGGTYDKNWIDHVWPKWPQDYSYEYHNSASASMCSPEGMFMDGKIDLELVNQSEDKTAVDRAKPSIANPTILLGFQIDGGPVTFTRLNIDTLFFDTAHKDRKNWRVHVSGRAVFNQNRNVQISIHPKQDWMVLEGARLKETFAGSLHPSQCV